MRALFTAPGSQAHLTYRMVRLRSWARTKLSMEEGQKPLMVYYFDFLNVVRDMRKSIFNNVGESLRYYGFITWVLCPLLSKDLLSDSLYYSVQKEKV